MNLISPQLKKLFYDSPKRYHYFSLFIFLTLFGNHTINAQIIINEILPPERVELKNIGTDTVDVSNYWICNFPSYRQISDTLLTIQCGTTLMEPGEILTITNFNNLSSDSEMGLFNSANFSMPSAIIDYVEWGSPGHQRSSVAVAAGIWTTGDFVPAIGAGMSIEYDATGDASSDWAATISPTICTENSNVPLICDVESGMISTEDDTNICIDGIPDPIDVDVTGNPTGSLGAWIITDDQNNILALPNTPPFDLDGAGVGTCIIWYVRYDTGFTGNVIGNNLSDLEGCYDISNGITVSREGPDGGTITLLDGSTSYAQCAGNIVFDVTHTTASPSLAYWYIITDDADNILGFQNSSAGSTLDLSAAPAGTCRIRGWSNNGGEPMPVVGDPISTLADGACEAISANFITVYREVPDGGVVTLADGSTTYTGVAGNIMVDVIHTTTAPNISYWYIITDDNNNILAFQNSTAGGMLDLSGAPPGVCRIWGWNYRGLADPVVGDPISTLMDDDCEDVSDAFITINRLAVPDAGTITTTDDTSICVDGIADPINVTVMGAVGSNSGWIITDDSNNILALPTAPPFDLDGAGVGTCIIWYIRYEDGLTGNLVGNNVSDLMGNFDLSNGITVTREAADGGSVSLLDGSTNYAQCAGNIVFDVTHTTNAPNLSYWYIITDDNNNILAFQNSTAGNTLDLSGAPPGTCRVWGWSYSGEPLPVAGDPITSLSDGACEAISSNFITVFREVPDGGVVTLADGSTTYTGTVGNIMVDVIHTTTAPNISYWYIITDDNNNILAFENSTAGGMLDLSGAPPGTCRIWGWNYRGLADPVVGDPIATLMDDDCEDVSDAFITVIRNPPVVDGGTISTTDNTNTCIDGNPDPINVTVMGAMGTNDGWIITDVDNNILALPPTATFDLEGAGVGVCILWYIRYEDGLTGLMPSNNISDLVGNFDLSNGITVNREMADGGTMTFADGSTEITAVAGDIMVDVIHTTTAPNLSYTYVITDDDVNILGFQHATAGGTLDLSSAPPGTCRIWGWSHSGVGDPVLGDPITSLSDDDCEAVSAAYLSVIRTEPVVEGGTISTTDNTNICVDGNPDPINVMVVEAIGTLDGWIITDDSNNILALPNASPFDLDGAGVGTCIIWYIRWEGELTGREVGNNLSDLSGNFDLSNGITVTREVPDGGSVTLLDGSTSYTQCAGNIVFDVSHTTTAANLSYWYIITDDNDNILDFQNSTAGGNLDLSAAPAGTCRVWGWSYSGEPVPTVGDPISTLADGACEAISTDFITVNREVANGGTLDSDFGTDVEICIDGQPDPITVSHINSTPNLSYWYIITDDADNILTWSTDPVIDLEGAGVGTCRIWGWNYFGLEDPIIGDPISSLTDDNCEDISDNFITVVRVDEGQNCVVSTSNLSSVEKLSIYPNPANDFLQVNYEGLENSTGQLVLVDLLGRTFLQKDLQRANDNLQLDIANIPFGVYMVRIDSENYSTVERIVIMK